MAKMVLTGTFWATGIGGTGIWWVVPRVRDAKRTNAAGHAAEAQTRAAIERREP